MSSVKADFLAACAEHDRSRAVRMIDEHWPTLLFSPETFEHLTATVHGATVDDLLHAPRAGLIAEVVGRLPVGSVRVALPGTSARVQQALRDGHARTMVEVATLGMISRRAGGLPLDALAIARASPAPGPRQLRHPLLRRRRPVGLLASPGWAGGVARRQPGAGSPRLPTRLDVPRRRRHRLRRGVGRAPSSPCSPHCRATVSRSEPGRQRWTRSSRKAAR